jgi:hypothetical protein
MAETARRQGDLFESSPPPTSIPTDAQQQMLQLLMLLLTEAFAGSSISAHGVDKGDDGDQDYA